MACVSESVHFPAPWGISVFRRYANASHRACMTYMHDTLYEARKTLATFGLRSGTFGLRVTVGEVLSG